MGIEAMLDTMQTSFTSNWGVQLLVDWTVGGEVAGVFKTTGQLSYVSNNQGKVFELLLIDCIE